MEDLATMRVIRFGIEATGHKSGISTNKTDRVVDN
jgi:hypothetical protein